MATLNIRKLPDQVHAKLRVRAAKAGRSMEAEVREILVKACEKSERPAFDIAKLQASVRDFFDGNPPKNVADDFIAERRREAEKE